ncbi:MAG TPA: 6,7-dimethyl-8-ribityllumazine synthase [Chthoniobacterales bacterium]|nr:6,7-dimethyl-8-ribityllumazine synthase [Chthoniobacterales bacterium]
MSTAFPPRPRVIATKRSFVLVASQFNAKYVQGLVNHATEELRALAPGASLSLHQVPGAFEIPIVVREVALRKKADAILAIGVILRGKTTHAQHLAHSVTNALQQIAIESGVPVIHVVLEMENEEQARERCLEKKMNRGIEAARAAVEISNIMEELRK